MTDEFMDARLRSAGERWRAGNNAAVDLAAPLELETPPGRRHRRAPWLLIASAAAVAAGLAIGLVAVGRGGGGNGTPTTHGAAALENTVWRLTGYGSAADQHSLSTLTVRNGQLVADDSCAVYTARAKVSGASIVFSGLDVREKGCTDAVGEGPQLDEGRAMLSGATRWTIDGRRLTLTHGSTRAHLVASDLPAPSAEYPTLTGTDWRLVSATDAEGHQTLLDSDRGATLRIDGTRLVTGDTCNTLSGSVTVNRFTLVPGQLGQTEIGCPASPVPAIVDAVFGGTIQAAPNGADLTLTRAGAGRLDYVWAPKNIDTGALTGRTWRPVLVAGEPTTLKASLRFEIQGARLTGSDGCTALDAIARITPGTMTITGVKAPAASCPPDTGSLDSYLANGIVLWRITDGRLVLFGAGAQAASIVLATGTPPAATSGLDGTWKLATVEQGAAAQSAPEATTITVRGKLATARAHCLLRPGSVTSMTIVLTDSNNDHDLCLAAVDPIMKGRFRWSITDGQLHLTKGSTVLIFDRS